MRATATKAVNNGMADFTAQCRELTRQERTAIKKLVIDMCANYDKKYGCLPLDCDCYMFGKCWTGGYCKYFQSAVLPLDPMLEASLLSTALDTRPCAFCGEPFPMNGRQLYCGAVCAGQAKNKLQRGYMRNRRGNR